MSGVQDTIKCPQCGQSEAFVEFETRDLSEYVFCDQCGYRQTTRPVIDRKRQAADPEHLLWAKLTQDGRRIFRTITRGGYGAYCLAGKEGIAQVGALRPIAARQALAQFKRDVKANPQLDPARCYLTRWNARMRQVEVLFGTLCVPQDP